MGLSHTRLFEERASHLGQSDWLPTDEATMSEVAMSIEQKKKPSTPNDAQAAAQKTTVIQPEQNDSISSEPLPRLSSSRFCVPVLDEPPLIKPDAGAEIVKEIDQLLTRIKSPKGPASDETAPIDIELLLNSFLLTLIREQTTFLKAKRTAFDAERARGDARERERLKELERDTAISGASQTLGNVERSIGSFGLVVAGIAGIASGKLPAGVAAICVGTLLAIDQLLEDSAKKAVANWIARGDRESELAWLNRLQLFCGLTSFAMSFGLQGIQAVNLAIGVSRTVLTATKCGVDIRQGFQKALLLELDFACEVSKKNVDSLLAEIQEMCTTIYQFYQNIHHIEEKRAQLAKAMLMAAV